jgi:hypothetical protein
MTIQTIEMDTNKVYSIIVEVGDMTKAEVIEYLTRVKSLYEGLGIKAVYSAMHDGVPVITINEVLPERKDEQ